ncbi:MAG: alpha/beta fold hydrolase [Bacteroidales bacterium]
MQKGEYTIASDDGIGLHFRYWEAEKSNICLCIVHGWGMDGSWYDLLARHFVQEGISVTTIDLRGHGHSAGKASRVRHLLDFDPDVEALLRESNIIAANSKKILMGHQMGALLAMQHYLLNKKDADALILSAPLFKPTTKISASRWLKIRMLSHIFPFLPVDVARYLTITVPDTYKNKNYTIPLMHVRLLYELKKIGKKMITRGYKINIPTLVMHGTNDSIALHRSSVVFARNTGFYTTFKSWPGKDHYLTETYDVEVLGYMLSWIQKTFSLQL